MAHVPYSRMQTFLEGVHEVLKNDGRVVFCDQLPKPGPTSGEYDTEGNLIVIRRLPDGSCYRVVKHYMPDEKIRENFGPYTDHVEIRRFPDCRRIVVSYQVKTR